MAGVAIREADCRGMAGRVGAALRALRRRAACGRRRSPGAFVTDELNPITGELVIIAPKREDRPNVYEGAPCPFCPGAENETPPEICRDGDPWRIRIFPNRYPPTAHSEIIVESALHDDTFDELAPDHAQRVVELYFEPYRALAPKTAYVCIFKNHGRKAGAS